MTTLLRAVVRASGLSRRKAFAAIRAGRVGVDGTPAADPSAPYTGGTLSLDGRPLAPPPTGATYLLLNKPPGFLSAVTDARGRPTVIDLVPEALRAPGLHPVGRLDLESAGLLILTNDGDLTYRLTHPRHEVEKEYWLALASPISDGQLAALRRGVEMDGQLRRPLRLRRLQRHPFQLAVTIREGRKRQVRRMLAAVGARVTLLRRVREGPLSLGSLPEGAVRVLTAEEVDRLRGGA